MVTAFWLSSAVEKVCDFLVGDRRVAVDEAREHAAQRLDAERERRHVEQQHVGHVALQHAGLDGGAHGDDLVRVDALMRLLAEEVLHDLLHLGHARHAADQHDLVDVVGGEARILERGLHGVDRALDEAVDKALELGARELHRQVLGARRVGGDEGQVDLGLARRRQLDLGLLGRLLEALQRELVLGQVDALVLLELARQVLDERHVEVLAAQEGVAVGRLHLEHAVADLEDRDVERAAAQVIDGDRLAVVLLQPVGERRGGGLVDDAQHFQAGDLAGILGGLALGVVEVGGHGDDGLLDLLAQILLGRLLHLLKDHGGDLRGGMLLGAGLDPGVAVVALDDLVGDELLVLLHRIVAHATADQALDGEDRVLGVGDGLALGRLADEALAIVGERDHGRRGARALRVLDHLGVLAVHDGDARVGRAQIDTDHLSHVHLLLRRAGPDPSGVVRQG